MSFNVTYIVLCLCRLQSLISSAPVMVFMKGSAEVMHSFINFVLGYSDLYRVVTIIFMLKICIIYANHNKLFWLLQKSVISLIFS